MTRLTNHVREKMAQALTRHRFNDCGNELIALSAALFNEAMDHWLDAETQRLLKRLAKLHPKSMYHMSTASLRARGMYVTIGAASVGSKGIFWCTEDKRISRLALRQLDDSDLPDELLARIADFALKTKTFAEDVSAGYRKALGTLGRFTTAKKLTEEWPEALPVIGHLIPLEDRALPVVQLDAINDEFGLPPTDRIAA